MEGIQIDWMAVGVAVFLNMFIGFVWYSQWLFGSNSCHKKGSNCFSLLPIFFTLITSVITAFFLALFQSYLDITNVSDGMFIGFYFWLGFVFTTQISPVIWQARPVKLFFIDAGYKLLSFLVMSGVLAA